MPYTDETVMPFGVHKGKQLADVPASYLLWLHENNKCTPELKQYIEANLSVIRLEAARNKRY